MNDDELITAVKESVTDVHMNIPAEQIVSRSRAIRARRRIPVIGAALTVAAGAALALTALVPPGHPASPQPGAQLAAWTVVKQADGNIRVTIHNLRDPAGLQSKLRADGIPASVTFVGQEKRSCHLYRTSGGAEKYQDLRWKVVQVYPRPGSTVVVIHPSALPSGTGLLLGTLVQPHLIGIEVHIVQPSQQCTGS